MKKIIWFFVGLLTVAVSYGAFQSGIITGTEFCIGQICVDDWSIFSRSLPGRIVVSSTSEFTGVKQAFDWINANAAHSYEVLIDAGIWDISDTITINNPDYFVTLRGLGFDVTTLQAASGLEGKPMFDIQSPADFSDLNLDASGLTGHGSSAGEDGIRIAYAGGFSQFQNMGIYGFNKGIDIENDSEVRMFNSALEDNVEYGVYISGGDYRSAETDYSNSAVGSYLYAGSGKFFSTEHDSYSMISGQISILYNPTLYTNYVDISIFDNNFTIHESPAQISGFDFSLVRDADVEIYGNINQGDLNPYAKINLMGNITGQTYTSNTWNKMNYIISDSFASKWGVTTTGRVTYLTNHKRSVLMRISASVTTSSQNSELQFAIIKNGNTATQYGKMNVTLDVNGRAFNFSQNIHINDVQKNDYFELYVYPVGGNETIILQNLNWLINSK